MTDRPATKKQFGQRLRALRSAKSESRRDLDSVVGYHGATAGFESGKRFPTVDGVHRICAHYGVTPDALIWR